jgi:hypothetical protein
MIIKNETEREFPANVLAATASYPISLMLTDTLSSVGILKEANTHRGI